jgi:hypothetical protein
LNFKNQFYRDWAGSDFEFERYLITYNQFFNLNKKNAKQILAMRATINVAAGDVPFEGQSVVGSDDIRGYSQGQYRADRNREREQCWNTAGAKQPAERLGWWRALTRGGLTEQNERDHRDEDCPNRAKGLAHEHLDLDPGERWKSAQRIGHRSVMFARSACLTSGNEVVTPACRIPPLIAILLRTTTIYRAATG